jgi:hypothetical protein
MGQAPTVALPSRLPLIAQPENRDETSEKDAKLINGYVEKNEATKETWIFKRPGLLQTDVAKSGNGYGVYNWQGDIYTIFGSTIYKNGAALSGSLNTAGGVYRFSSSLGATPRLQFGNGAASYNYDSGAGVVAISGANFPSPAVKGWAYLDGTTYVMDAGADIYGCTTINDPTLWTDVLNVLTAQIEPDAGVALAKQLVYVVALKGWTTEVFYDAKYPTASPLGPVQGAKVDYGCVSADSVQDLNGALFWISTNRSSGVQVLMFDHLKASIISTKPVERLLSEADFSTVFSFAFNYEGHRFYGITLKASNLTLVYDAAESLWAQWTDTSGNYFPIVSVTKAADNGRILQHETNGKLYLLDAWYTTDDGELITVDLYTPNFDGGVRRRKHLKMMEFIGDQTAGSVLQVRVNDFDYAPTKWSNFRRVELSQRKPTLTDCGTFMRRVHHLRHRENTRLRLQAIELQMDVGTL